MRGKAYVHWHSWHDAYPGLVSWEYLDRITLEKAERIAFSCPDNQLIARDHKRVIGFIGYGSHGKDGSDTGEIFALYVLSDYYGIGIGFRLMEAGLEQLKKYPKVCPWVLKGSSRVIRFYEKCGFFPDGEEVFSPVVRALEIRMVLKR